MCPSKVSDGQERGWIIPIGGAEQQSDGPEILRRFVGLCGGAVAEIAIIPTASKMDDTGRRYERIFADLGARSAISVDFEDRSDTEKPEKLALLERASGIFFTGGNQLRLATILGGTTVARLVRSRNAGGLPVAGTSAGAAFISEHMIAFGDGGASPVAGAVRMAPGLGLTNRFVIDQHFRQRDRLGRLLAAIAFNPFAVGIGLDENTAAFIGPDNTVEVEGSGAVTVVDAAGIDFSSMDEVDEGNPVCMLGVVVHILVKGATFNLATRVASPGTLKFRKKSEA
jgi:cyanophycinase